MHFCSADRPPSLQPVLPHSSTKCQQTIVDVYTRADTFGNAFPIFII